MSGIDVDREWKLYINGEWVAATSTYDIIDPNTTKVVGHAPEATAAQARDAAAAAKAALPAWRALPQRERAAYLARLADVLAERTPGWVDIVQAETGATLKIARTMQVSGATVDRFRWHAKEFNIDEAVPPFTTAATGLGPAGLVGAMVHRQPVGVVACITPYNFPLTNVAGKIAPALIMGNTCVIKPAPQDPLGILLLAEAIHDAGFPPGVVNVLTGSGPEAPAALVDTPDVNMISFTGSTQIGAKIYENSGKTMKRLLMELGGKGALIMTDDADVGAATQAIASVWGFHSGQICTAPTRVLCHRSLYDETVETLKTIAGFLTVGDALDDATLVGPVITETHRDRVEEFIKGGVDDGATLVTGGERPDLPGYFVAPTLLADCRSDMHVVQEEVFGPVVVVVPHDGDDEAVALANDSAYGLFSYVYSGDMARAYRLGQQIDSGNVALNSVQPHMEAPFGGFKMSGVGRDRGRWGLEAYTEVQAISWLS
ncbi:MAG: aldehyde dehydrogenase family protein [Acidimicrobiales bacterium]